MNASEARSLALANTKEPNEKTIKDILEKICIQARAGKFQMNYPLFAGRAVDVSTELVRLGFTVRSSPAGPPNLRGENGCPETLHISWY
jgi:hypothetical protein